uniref:OmpR/PhoB-type domain-containing protein n=1 Tax=mine drainage metagenome TaxID=410659 RepID=E6PH27_9ZZZZ
MQARVISITDWARQKHRTLRAGFHRERAGVSILSEDQIACLAKALALELDRLKLIDLSQPQREHRIVIGPLCVDFDGHEALVHDECIALKPREFALLKALVQNIGCVLTREVLLELAWPDPLRVNSNRTVDVHINRLRSKLGNAASLLCTVGGVGYKLARVAQTGTNNQFPI